MFDRLEIGIINDRKLISHEALGSGGGACNTDLKAPLEVACNSYRNLSPVPANGFNVFGHAPVPPRLMTADYNGTE